MVIAGRKLISGPFGESDLVDPVAGVKLRMLQEAFDRIHVGVGNGGGVEPLDHLLGGKFRKVLLDQRLQRVAILHALRIVAKARIARPAPRPPAPASQSAVHSRAF